jgi:hypothetical protein
MYYGMADRNEAQYMKFAQSRCFFGKIHDLEKNPSKLYSLSKNLSVKDEMKSANF